MAAPRQPSHRATRVRGERPVEPRGRRQPPPEPEDVADPARPRSVVDHGLARRSALERIRAGDALLREEHTDADPYLLRAARHHGEPTERPCPICAAELVHVTYVFGDELGPYSGRIKASADLPVMAYEHGSFRVYVVEVCQGCGWNHLTLSYVLGDGVPRRPPARPADLLD